MTLESKNYAFEMKERQKRDCENNLNLYESHESSFLNTDFNEE